MGILSVVEEAFDVVGAIRKDPPLVGDDIIGDDSDEYPWCSAPVVEIINPLIAKLLERSPFVVISG